MKSEETVQIDGRLSAAVAVARRARDGDRRTQLVVGLFAVRHHDVQAVSCAALENRNQNLLTWEWGVGGVECTPEPKGCRPHSHHSQGGTAEKNTTGHHRITSSESLAIP